MARMASAARDIPQAFQTRDNLTVVAERSEPATVAKPRDLPTPPNSISPGLPAHGLKAQLRKARLEPVDSDLDLHDDNDSHQRSVSPALDASGDITCALLAKHHLPDILLNHGPLALRHIMGYLTTSVPGFSAIPPAKARRLVVGALSGRWADCGGLDGDVMFDKKRWGVYGATRRGAGALPRKVSPSHSSGIPISSSGGRVKNKGSRSSVDDFTFSQDGRGSPMLMPEYEADKMSMDGSASASCSEAPDDDVVMNDDPEDVTDDEDWASMGAAALRAESYPNPVGQSGFTPLSNGHFGGIRSFSAASGMARPPQANNIDMSALAGTSDAQEREAIEALMRLGSV